MSTSYYNFKYDFRGNLLASQELHAFSGTATDTLTTSNSYDHRGRLRSSVTRLGGRGAQSAEAISTYAYNSLGQMAVKRLGGEADVTNYTYNIQGWLTSQASPNFTLGLRYYDPVKSASTSYFGGNIAEVEWGHLGQTPNAYSFSYDALSRLTGANHYVGSSLTNSFTESGLSYDLNGNILSLNRSFGSGASNSYSMLYNGNQLASVNSGAAYSYDENGNTIQSGKNNLQFAYNFLNLLSRVSDATGKVAVYDWGADGLKRKVSVEGDATAGFTYLGSLVYMPSGSSYTLESVAFPEGRFVKTTSGFEVNYHIKDHLGSVRATMNQNGVLSNQSDYYPFGERWSASGEATTNRYLFSGKEKQTAGDLQGMNLLDFGARMYDPEIPRWLTNDPLAEEYYEHTPYLYCGGNPVSRIDPNGMAWKLVFAEDDKDKKNPIGYEWVDEDKSYDKKGKLLPGLFSQAIFFTHNGTHDASKDKNIGSSTAIVYLADGTIVRYQATTLPSDVEKSATVPQGVYKAEVGLHNKKYTALRMSDVNSVNGRIELGGPNPAHKDRTYAEGINIHKAGGGNVTGFDSKKRAISAGCMLIDINQWGNFMNHFTAPDQMGNVVSVSISRTDIKPVATPKPVAKPKN